MQVLLCLLMDETARYHHTMTECSGGHLSNVMIVVCEPTEKRTETSYAVQQGHNLCPGWFGRTRASEQIILSR